MNGNKYFKNATRTLDILNSQLNKTKLDKYIVSLPAETRCAVKYS